MLSVARITALVLLAGALVAPASRVGAQDPAPPDGTGLGIRLLEAPEETRGDPRAEVYVIDHVEPGATITRRIGIVNDTPDPLHTELYVAPAVIDDGTFIVGARTNEGPLTEWGSMAPGSADLAPRQSTETVLTIDVPADAEDGEYYGAAMAEAPPYPGEGVRVAPRVGIRIYLSVGDGAQPESDFEISTLTASRRDDGTPVVSASVTNTGGRALDMNGELELDHGPAGLSAGPFPAELGTTLRLGATEPVTVVLHKELPNGPWDATLTLRSGQLERTVTATILFPDPGAAAKTFDAKAKSDDKAFWGVIALLLLLLVLLGLFLWWLLWRRRRKKEDEEEEEEDGPSADH